VLAALAEKSTTLAARLNTWLPDGVPLGVPAGALRGPFAGSSGGGDLVRAFKGVLNAEGLGAGIGAPAVEGFLWNLAAAEPTLQRACGAAAREEKARGGVAT
jgi:hypothetical protein